MSKKLIACCLWGIGGSLIAATLTNPQRFQPDRWNGAVRVNAISGFVYGFPSGGDSESNVILQFLFDESSEPVIDEVAGFELYESTSTNGTFTYQADTSAYSPLMDEGLDMQSDGSGGISIEQATGASTYKIGTNDVTVEWVAKYSSTQDTSVPYAWSIGTITTAYGLYGYYPDFNTASAKYLLRLRSSSGLTQFSFDLEPAFQNMWGDGEFHKHRLTVDRDGNAEYYIDGVQQDTGKSVAARDGEDIPCDLIVIGAFYNGNGANSMSMTITEWRYSHNLVNNSGGPGGG